MRVAQYEYILIMIVSFKHKGLEKYFSTGNSKGIQQKHKKRLRLMLGVLDTAFVIEDIDLPGFRLHQLSGQRKDIWSITVNGNWRLTFRYENGNVHILNYEDYH